jgi:Arc/MetJ family transcription regulator
VRQSSAAAQRAWRAIAHPEEAMAMTELRKPTRPPRQSRTTRRVTLNVDEELLREAGEFLGTTSMTETINGALDEYVSLQMRLQLVNRELDLTPEMLDEIRRPRTF